MDIPAASQYPSCVHVTEAGANMVPKTCSLSWRPHEGLSSSVVKELGTYIHLSALSSPLEMMLGCKGF